MSDRPSLAVTAFGAGLTLAGACAVLLSLTGVSIPAMLWYSFCAFVIAAGWVITDVGYLGPTVDAWYMRMHPAQGIAPDDDAAPPDPDPFSPWPGGRLGLEYSTWHLRVTELLRAAILASETESDCIPRWDKLTRADGTPYSSRAWQVALECLPPGVLHRSEAGTFSPSYSLYELLRAVENYEIVLIPPRPAESVPGQRARHTGAREFAGEWRGEGGG